MTPRWLDRDGVAAYVLCHPHQIAAITGHASLAMVEHYTREADQDRLGEAAIVRWSGKNK